MAQNSAYKLDGHVIERLDLVCKDDDDTKEQAAGLVDEPEVELWQLCRMNASFPAKR